MRAVFQFGTTHRLAEITDGLSNTIFVGEKQVAIGREGRGWQDCSIYNGNYYKCSSRPAGGGLTTNPRDPSWLFGSRHTGVVQFCFGDGHVRSLPVSLNPYILELLGKRDDGQVIPDY
jgi:prepilin-type processing-associated H-X9-DG protein